MHTKVLDTNNNQKITNRKLIVLEKKCIAKSGHQNLCEDNYFINDNYICVVDGVTSKSDLSWGDHTSGKLASQLVVDAIRGLSCQESKESCFELINDSFIKYYKRQGIFTYLKKNKHARPAAQIIIYSKYHNEIWLLGDCQALVNGQLFNNPKIIDNHLAQIRANIILQEINEGKTIEYLMQNDLGRKYIEADLKKQTCLQNIKQKTKYAYYVMDGFFAKYNEIKTIELSTSDYEIVFATDGYPKLFNSLAESEKELARLLKIDPLCIKENLSTKGLRPGNISFDDRTYLKFQIKN